jgi:hypothetical protein
MVYPRLIGNTMTLKLLSPSNKRGDGELLIKEEKEKKKKTVKAAVWDH